VNSALGLGRRLRHLVHVAETLAFRDVAARLALLLVGDAERAGRPGMSYFFHGASGNDKPDSKTIRSLDSTPLGSPLTTYASIA
jgi:hypothetical protein